MTDVSSCEREVLRGMVADLFQMTFVDLLSGGTFRAKKEEMLLYMT